MLQEYYKNLHVMGLTGAEERSQEERRFVQIHGKALASSS